jgi:hypothetical protein
MTCKHNWHFVDGLTKRIRCTKCAAMQFTYNKEEFEKYMIASPSKGYSLADTRPYNIVFYNGNGPTPENEVMRIDATGVTVNPKVSVEDAAGAVIRALDGYIKGLVQREYERGVIDGRQIQVQKEVERKMKSYEHGIKHDEHTNQG